MQEHVEVTGIVLKAEPIGDYDRRVVILTLERGKITAFARGARKPNSSFVASTNPFTFGLFRLYEGKSSYTLNEVEVKNYFEELRDDFAGAYYGMYFLEIADYLTRENNDEKEMLKLLYQSLRALMHPGIDNRLIRYIYEIKAVVINGEFAGVRKDITYLESTLFTIDFIVKSSVEKLYTFAVKDEVLEELSKIADMTVKKTMHYQFKSVEILDSLM